MPTTPEGLCFEETLSQDDSRPSDGGGGSHASDTEVIAMVLEVVALGRVVVVMLMVVVIMLMVVLEVVIWDMVMV